MKIVSAEDVKKGDVLWINGRDYECAAAAMLDSAWEMKCARELVATFPKSLLQALLDSGAVTIERQDEPVTFEGDRNFCNREVRKLFEPIAGNERFKVTVERL